MASSGGHAIAVEGFGRIGSLSSGNGIMPAGATDHSAEGHRLVLINEDSGQAEALASHLSKPAPLSGLELARHEAQRILEEARRQAEVVAEEAYHQGFEQGERAGALLGQQKLEPIVKTLDSLVQEIIGIRMQIVRQMEGELVRVAMAIATRILHKELSQHPEAVVSVAREALKRTVTGGRIVLRLHPLDIEYLQQSGSILPEFARHSEEITLKPDYAVLRGGVIAETESGQIDASIETQLAILWNALVPGEAEESQEPLGDAGAGATPN
ncbi:MAG: FliH/SctL family protein [Candidatus Sumerlaeota bacterium]|nr:FliH/SctL family protein [Candidatus Sumerlaeota bacterium]